MHSIIVHFRENVHEHVATVDERIWLQMLLHACACTIQIWWLHAIASVTTTLVFHSIEPGTYSL